jgi:hypothetical protein
MATARSLFSAGDGSAARSRTIATRAFAPIPSRACSRCRQRQTATSQTATKSHNVGSPAGPADVSPRRAAPPQPLLRESCLRWLFLKPAKPGPSFPLSGIGAAAVAMTGDGHVMCLDTDSGTQYAVRRGVPPVQRKHSLSRTCTFYLTVQRGRPQNA